MKERKAYLALGRLGHVGKRHRVFVVSTVPLETSFQILQRISLYLLRLWWRVLLLLLLLLLL
jgi:hypothetical protein